MDSGLKHEYGIDAKQAPTVTYVNTSTLNLQRCYAHTNRYENLNNQLTSTFIIK